MIGKYPKGKFLLRSHCTQFVGNYRNTLCNLFDTALFFKKTALRKSKECKCIPLIFTNSKQNWKLFFFYKIQCNGHSVKSFVKLVKYSRHSDWIIIYNKANAFNKWRLVVRDITSMPQKPFLKKKTRQIS